MNKIQKKIFISIFLLAAFLRFWQLGNYPVSLNFDEISHGYNAYSLLKTGKDQWGVKWPIFNFRAYGDYPTTLNMYLTIPFVYFFGLNAWSIRLPCAILGFGLVILAYFLGQIIFKKTYPALLLMFITAISPWTFFTSRTVFQSTAAQFFFALGILLILKGLESKPKLFSLGLINLALSMYGYHNTRIACPLMIVAIIILFYKKIKIVFNKHQVYSFITLILFLFLFIPQINNLFNRNSQARSQWVFVLNPAAINTINQQRNNFKGNPIVAKIFYNKPVFFITEVTKNYLNFLNPKILFFEGSKNFQFNIPNTGIIFSIFLPFYYLGILVSIKKSFQKDTLSIFILLWFLIGLIPAVITTGDFPVLRSMTTLPVPFIFITSGFIVFVNLFKNSSIQSFIFISFLTLVFVQSIFYLKNYFTDYFKNYSENWQYGYQQAIAYIKDHYQDYDQIILTKKYGEPHEYVLFFWPWNPSTYQNDPKKIWDYHADWYWVDAFDKFRFVNDWDIKTFTSKLPEGQKTLLITSSSNYNQSNSQLLETINFLDNKPAFDILNIYDSKN